MLDSAETILRSVGEDLLRIIVTLGRVALFGVLAFFVARYLGRFVVRTMTLRSIGRSGALLVGRLASIGVWIVGISSMLASLGVNTTGLLAFISVSTVAVSLSLQDVLRNFVSGVILLIERPFQVGDRIKVRDVVGEVQGIDVRTTLIRNSEGALVMVPNATIFTEIVTNRSHYRTRRLDLKITANKSAMMHAEAQMMETLREVKGVRSPIPAPLLRSSSPEEYVMELSLLIDSSNDVERDVVQQLVDHLGDVTLEVIKNP